MNECILNCGSSDPTCIVACTEIFTTESNKCPCQSGCPTGCPCPIDGYSCYQATSTILPESTTPITTTIEPPLGIMSTLVLWGRSPANVINFGGADWYRPTFNYTEGVNVHGSCWVNYMGEMWVLGGEQKADRNQVS